MILAQKQANRSMQHDRDPKKSPYAQRQSITKEARIYNGDKNSISDVGKTGQLHVKEWKQNILQHHMQK